MKAISVPLSSILAIGLRLDTQPYVECATKSPEMLRVALKASARRAYFRHARRGLVHIRNVKVWNSDHKMDGIKVLHGT